MTNRYDQRRMGFPTFASRGGNATRTAGLEHLKQLRLHGGAQHMDSGSVVLSIPELDFAVICARYPDLMSPDAEISTRAWDKFLVSSESKPYRVRDTDGFKKGAT